MDLPSYVVLHPIAALFFLFRGYDRSPFLRLAPPPQLITKASPISSVSYLLAVFHHPAHHHSTILPLSMQTQPSFFLYCCFNCWPCLAACRILVPWLGIEPRSPWWKCWLLTSEPPGNFLNHYLSLNLLPWSLSPTPLPALDSLPFVLNVQHCVHILTTRYTRVPLPEEDVLCVQACAHG